jgi:serine protease Do
MRRLFLTAVLLSLVAVVVLAHLSPRPGDDPQAGAQAVGTAGYTLAEAPPITPEEVPHLVRMQEEFNRVTDAVSPSVVSITTTRAEARPELPPALERFFGGRLPDEIERQALGSGVIVTREGHLITNRHVVEGMDEVEVQLHDGRVREAQVVAIDPVVDMAVLKIQGNDLMPLPLGNSDSVRVGDLVMAVGNPLGLAGSVTNGIVSATGRPLQADVDVQYIQTNAEINPGNSGGPLVNIRGEVVGINTAIAAVGRSGWMGIGFAIPSNVIQESLESVIRHGRIIRGHLGVRVAELTPDMARRAGVEAVEGLIVVEVVPGSPAQRAGLQPRDVIVALDGEPITQAAELRRRVTATEVGRGIDLEVQRGGTRRTITAEIAEMPQRELTR